MEWIVGYNEFCWRAFLDFGMSLFYSTGKFYIPSSLKFLCQVSIVSLSKTRAELQSPTCCQFFFTSTHLETIHINDIFRGDPAPNNMSQCKIFINSPDDTFWGWAFFPYHLPPVAPYTFVRQNFSTGGGRLRGAESRWLAAAKNIGNCYEIKFYPMVTRSWIRKKNRVFALPCFPCPAKMCFRALIPMILKLL